MTAPNDAFIDSIGICYGKVPSLLLRTTYAKRVKGRAARPGDQCSLIHGKQQYVWRAVDQDGEVLDILVQSRRNKKAAKRFFRKLLKSCCCVPRSITTDKLKGYAAAKEDEAPSVKHWQDKGLNNRAENSHQAIRARERGMRGFKSGKQARQLLAVFSVKKCHS